jgi:hypothetical protein
MLRLISVILIGLLLNGCASLQGKGNSHTALCTQLKGRIIMSGATSIQRNATKERNDLDRLDQSYRDEGCE